MKSLKNYLGKTSGVYGVLHALGCPTCGLLGLALMSGVTLHPSITNLVEKPHEIITHHVFEPAWNKILKDDGSEGNRPYHSCSSCSDHYEFKGSFEEIVESEQTNLPIGNNNEENPRESRHGKEHAHTHYRAETMLSKKSSGSTQKISREERVHRYAHTSADVTGWGALSGFLVFSARKYYLKRKDKKDCSCGNH